MTLPDPHRSTRPRYRGIIHENTGLLAHAWTGDRERTAVVVKYLGRAHDPDPCNLLRTGARNLQGVADPTRWGVADSHGEHRVKSIP